MSKTLPKLFLNLCPYNQKSKIRNRNWVGIVAIGVLFATCGPVVQAQQQPGNIKRIGIMASGSVSSDLNRIDVFRQALRDLGYVEGKNVVLERRYAEGKPDRYPALAAELVHLKADVIVVEGGSSARAAKNATQMIPIVMANVSDAVEIGLVASLAKPGGNITGLTVLARSLGENG